MLREMVIQKSKAWSKSNLASIRSNSLRMKSQCFGTCIVRNKFMTLPWICMRLKFWKQAQCNIVEKANFSSFIVGSLAGVIIQLR